ncbi:hypothetical protein JW960_13810 [candidate division KSB1 bacterium]|nr:hypothetical protein [candidate division KSB1 bacterium]
MRYVLIIILFFIIPSCLFSVEEILLISPEDARADIDTLLYSLNHIHATFKTYASTPKIVKRINSIKDSIQAPISSYDLFKILQPIVAIDGHTSLVFRDKITPDIQNAFFPIKICVFRNGMYVKKNVSDNNQIEQGMEIIAINGVPTERVTDKVLSFIPGETRHYKLYKLQNEFPFFYRLAYGNFLNFSIELQAANKHIIISVPGVKAERVVPDSNNQLKIKFIDSNTAYLNIGKFKKPPVFLHNIDSLFTVLHDRKISYLIIDSRHGGGITDLADSLVSYLTDKSFHSWQQKAIKISDKTQTFINEIQSTGSVEDGFFVIHPHDVKPPIRTNGFTGKFFLLTGPGTNSTAVYFAALLKCNQLATIVGQECGQPLISNGNIASFILPHSKIPVMSSNTIFRFPCAENSFDSVKPDYEVIPTLDDLLNDNDSALNYTLKFIQSSKQKE